MKKLYKWIDENRDLNVYIERMEANLKNINRILENMEATLNGEKNIQS